MKKHIEILLLKLAIWILRDRNVQRAKYISRKDNNYLFQAGCDIGNIVDRIKSDYK